MKLVHLFSLALLAALPARADRIQCNFGDQLKYPFDANQAQTTHCRPADLGPPKCATTIKSIVDAELDLNGRLAETCRRVEQVDHDVAETIGMDQLAAMNRQLVIYQGLAQDYRDFLSALNRQYREIAKTLLQDPGPLGRELKAEELSAAAATDRHALERQQFRSAIKDNTFRAMKALNPPAPRNPAETDGDPSVFAARNGVAYMKKILQQSEEASKTLSQITGFQGQIQANIDNFKKSNDTNKDNTKNTPASTVAGGSGLDLKSLASLATAGAGLAQMLNKKNAANSAADFGATSPTPTASNIGKAGQNGPSVSKLDDGTKAESKPPVSATQAKKENAASPRTPSGQAYSPYSDISKSQASPFASSSSSPASAKANGSGGGAGGGASRSGEAEAAKQASTNAAPASPEDGGSSLGAGLLGGGGGPPPLAASSAPGAPGAEAAASTPEAAMNDLLHEMKETAEGGAANPDAQGIGSDIAMASEDLFPRVRACYVRIMKAGRVLDGLGEKITEENQ